MSLESIVIGKTNLTVHDAKPLPPQPRGIHIESNGPLSGFVGEKYEEVLELVVDPIDAEFDVFQSCTLNFSDGAKRKGKILFRQNDGEKTVIRVAVMQDNQSEN
jgi:hypothetical protein